jgi:tyrosine-protein phosphatase SIW14
MITGSDHPLTGLWLVRTLLVSIVFLAVVGSACRQAPNPLLFVSMNTTRKIADPAAVQWAEPVPAQGLPNLHRVSADLYRGAQPKREGFAELQKLGVKTVVNLRKPDGIDARLPELGFAYEHIPMTAYALKDDDIVRFLQVAGDPASAPIFLHCRRGADRTGLMTAVYRIAIQGWTKDQAIAEMTRGGFRFNHGYQNIITYIQDLDIEQIRQRAGLTSTPAASLLP